MLTVALQAAEQWLVWVTAGPDQASRTLWFLFSIWLNYIMTVNDADLCA